LRGSDASGRPLPSAPIVFAEATSSIAGPNDDLVLPEGVAKIDWNMWLGVVN